MLTWQYVWIITHTHTHRREPSSNHVGILISDFQAQSRAAQKDLYLPLPIFYEKKFYPHILLSGLLSSPIPLGSLSLLKQVAFISEILVLAVKIEIDFASLLK